MAQAIVSLFMVALLLMGTGLMADAAFRAWVTISDGWKKMEMVSGSIARTSVAMVGATISGADLEVKVTNNGLTPLRQFNNWDVIVQYYDILGTYHQQRLVYATTPGLNQWTVGGIYREPAAIQPEIYQPGMLDGGESIVFNAVLSPAASPLHVHQVIIVTENGVQVGSTF